MKLLQKCKQLWRSNAGYAMIMVLCALLLFVVLGANALLAAQASAGTTARKQDDTQAYVLATSALRCVSEMIQQGDFSKHIQTKVLAPGGSFTDAAGKPLYKAPVKADIALPEQPAGAQQPSVTVDFNAENLRNQSVAGSPTIQTVDLLTARITVMYRSATYSFLADFRQQPNYDKPEETKWVLKGYRNNRVYLPPKA